MCRGCRTLLSYIPGQRRNRRM
ncbi:MAG: hypothetical protein II289_04560 [Bacteroidales bacterium]|nr:hypothetical protein [Bacteroidales bacterium]